MIGRAAVAALLGAGHEVVVLSRSRSNAATIAELGATAVPGDIFDPASLERAYAGADAVINLATKVPTGYGALLPRAWRLHDRLRTDGVRNVVEAARRAGVRRVVQESVSFLYADQDQDWVSEQSPLGITPMTEPVAVSESLVQDYACDSRAGVVLRLGNIVGDDAQTRFWLRAAAGGRPVGAGTPQSWAHLLHTDDLGAAVLAATHAPSGVYNVGAEPVRREHLVQGYADAVGAGSGAFMGSLTRWFAGPRLEPLTRSLRVCSDHFAAQTGWRPTRPRFDAGWFDVAINADPRLVEARR